MPTLDRRSDHWETNNRESEIFNHPWPVSLKFLKKVSITDPFFNQLVSFQRYQLVFFRKPRPQTAIRAKSLET